MSTLRRTGVPLVAGVVCGIALVVACDRGPSKTEAQTTGGSLTCTVPPVTVAPVTCTVPPATVTCTVPPVACNTAGPTRSAAAGTWSISGGASNGTCSGQLHLGGSDGALTGAWICSNASMGTSYAGTVIGDYFGGKLRLNFTVGFAGGYGASGMGSVFLVDASVASGGASATGTSTPGPMGGTFSMTLQ